MEQNEWGPLGPITESPDDLMDIPVEELITKLAMRLHRLHKFEELAAEFPGDHRDPIRWGLKREQVLVRVAETAARARIRELATLLFDLSSCFE